MKPIKLAAFTLTLAMSASAFAQPPQEGRRPEGGPGFGQGGRGRFPNPVLEAIDKDKNGELSPEEIEGAVAALKTLDKNNDGKLEQSELRPNMEGMGREGMGRGFGGPEGRGGAGGENAEAMVERLMASDANKDGKLSKEEIPERLQAMMARGDKNSDGALDKEEIMAIARERAAQGGGAGFGGGGPGGPEGRGGEFMAQMFERADADKNGKLSGDEIPPFMRERMEAIDTNKDGALDKAELEAGMSRMREGRGGRGEGEGRGEGRGEGGRRRPQAEGEGDAPKKE